MAETTVDDPAPYLTRRIATLAAVGLLVLAGCGTEPEQPAPTPTTPTMRAEVVEKLHDPDEVWHAGGVAFQGTWDLRICLLDPEGQPREDRCALLAVSEGEWAAHEVGDEIPAPEGARWE